MWLKLFLLSITCCLVHANLEDPDVFFGPTSLVKYKRLALKFLDQDDLMKIYGEQAAIVVSNNQDSVPLFSGYFSRLRKLLEGQMLLKGQMLLVLAQDFLYVHPGYYTKRNMSLYYRECGVTDPNDKN